MPWGFQNGKTLDCSLKNIRVMPLWVKSMKILIFHILGPNIDPSVICNLFFAFSWPQLNTRGRSIGPRMGFRAKISHFLPFWQFLAKICSFEIFGPTSDFDLCFYSAKWYPVSRVRSRKAKMRPRKNQIRPNKAQRRPIKAQRRPSKAH